MNPLLIEVITPMITNLEIGCQGCSMILDDLGLKNEDRRTCTDEYPQEWKERMDLLSGWITEIKRAYRGRVHVRLIDAQSPMGLWKQIRHRISSYPTWIVGNRATYTGWDSRELMSLIEKRISTMEEDLQGSQCQ